MKILFIEDNPEEIIYTNELLEESGHEVDIIDESDSVIDRLNSLQKYDLIILDLMLMLGDKIELSDDCPEVGIALYKQIREAGFKKPILIVSALSKSEVWNFFKDDECVEYYHKPTITSSLLSKVNKIANNI